MNHIKTNITRGLLAATLILSSAVLGSCTDELDIQQHGVLDQSTYYKTDDDANEVLTAMYTEIGNLEFAYYTVKNLLSDDYWPGQVSHEGDMWDLGGYDFGADQPYVDGMFSEYYNVIGKCNVIIDNLTSETDAVKRAKAEAKVVRAWMHFELTTLWGNPPLVDHLLTTSDSAQPNADPATLWAFMEKDLTEAIQSGALMQKSNIDDNTVYHVTKQYAQALLGKVYLWQNKYSDAAAVLDEVINSGLYGLYQGDYADIWSVHHENNREDLFETNFVNDAANPGGLLRLHQIMMGLSFSDYNTGSNTLGLASLGLSACLPTGDLYNAFVAEEGENGYRLNQTIKTPEYMSEHGYKLNTGVTLCGEGYFMWKDHPEKDAYGPSGYDIDNNIRWMRYSEVLLLAAEANLQAGNQSKANTYLNMVRERAKLSDETATLDAIKNEKRLELCGEGVRYQDLVRWGDAPTVLKDRGRISPVFNSSNVVTWEPINGSSYGFKAGKNERLPYPSSELRVNRNIVQNPGW